MTGIISDIKKFAVHDGPGIRTTIFLKGCPLSCIWCHNPESISPKPQLAYISHKCVNCGECVKQCNYTAHQMINGSHVYIRENCTLCGECVDVCRADALTLYGREISVGELMEVILKDINFFRNSHGGLTVSGGEPLLQSGFCRELFIEAKRHNIHTAVDTCGAVPWSRFENVLDYTDLFLYDLKHMDSEKHKLYTGLNNDKVLSNLRKLSELGKSVEIRIPVIPGVNDSDKDMKAFTDFIGTLKSVERVKQLQYHDYARTKYESLGMEYKLT